VLRCLPCAARALICLALGSALFFPGDASASQVYVSNAGSSTTSAFSIGSGGALSPIACSEPNCKTGTSPSFQSLVISPDQAPTAAFTDTTASAGSASGFDGSASTASPGQSVARYDWSFGDGMTAQNAGPTPSHTYSAPGTYTVSLTVTDSAGCSTQLIFTGQTASCNGSTVASTTRTLTVPPPSPPLALVTAIPLLAPTLSSLSETAKTWREGNGNKSKKKKLPLGTTFSFSLSEPASVTFTFTEPASGRKAGKTCVAQTNRNKKKHRCTRTVVAGTLMFSAHAGTNKVRFEGLISKQHKLKPGGYTLLITATASGKHSTTGTLHFTIANG
jgi:methionine-rich copper-binding protein CopC